MEGDTLIRLIVAILNITMMIFTVIMQRLARKELKKVEEIYNGKSNY